MRLVLPVALLTFAIGTMRGLDAHAVMQPDGTVIPVGTEMQSLLTARGEALDARNDAAILPERYVPGCVLTFTLVTRGPALFRNAFGWYNVTGARPNDDDLHVLIPCDAPTGFVATLDLRRETAYRGGEIGFFLRTPESSTAPGTCFNGDCCARAGHPGRTYYTERAFNPDNMGASSYIHLLTYDSRVTPRSFYFAWEDLFGGGDNQFTDFVALVGNIVCSGAGATCNTGRPGICAAGTQQCRNGALECVQDTQPRMERCNGLDDDCDGRVDVGDALCPTNFVCERGTCVERCLEDSCFPGEVCTPSGSCVEAACATVNCPSGERCVAGRCVGPCEGVRCPGAQVCRAGRCADPCAGVMCDADQVCVAGVCQPRCECRPCAMGQTCESDGRCRATRCVGVRCDPGSTCVDGTCRPDCEGAMCPVGERCESGMCVPQGMPDAGGVDVPRLDVPQGTDAGVTMDVVGDTSRAPFPRSGGCACATVGITQRGPSRSTTLLLTLAGSVLAMRRRRRSTSSSAP